MRREYSKTSLASSLVKIANDLDARGLTGEADTLDKMLIDLGEFSNLDDTNITKDEAFAAGQATCSNKEEPLDDALESIIRRLSSHDKDALLKESRFGLDLQGDIPVTRQPEDVQQALETQRKNKKTNIDAIHLALGVMGLAPVIGEPFDALNSAIYIMREKPVQAILSAISIIPVWGDFVGKGAQLLLAAAKSGLESVKMGSKVYTVSSLKGELVKIMNHNDNKIKSILGHMDKAGLEEKDSNLYTIYIRDIKNKIEKV